MPSRAWTHWDTDRAATLDEIEHAHAQAVQSRTGRLSTTQHINQAYAVLLSSHFQGFCRDLHGECVDLVVGATNPTALRPALHRLFLQGRKLDSGNPNPGNLGADFGRFGLVFWDDILRHDSRNSGRRDHLEDLNRWRNAIAHQAFDATVLGAATPRVDQIRRWRNACHQLACSFDIIMGNYLQTVLGNRPW